MLRQESLPVSLSNVMGLMIRYLCLHFLLITYWCISIRWTLLESMSRKVLCPAQIFRNTLFAIFFGQIWFCYSTKYKSNWKLKGTGHLAHNLLLNGRWWWQNCTKRPWLVSRLIVLCGVCVAFALECQMWGNSSTFGLPPPTLAEGKPGGPCADFYFFIYLYF